MDWGAGAHRQLIHKRHARPLPDCTERFPAGSFERATILAKAVSLRRSRKWRLRGDWEPRSQRIARPARMMQTTRLQFYSANRIRALFAKLSPLRRNDSKRAFVIRRRANKSETFSRVQHWKFAFI